LFIFVRVILAYYLVNHCWRRVDPRAPSMINFSS
jgi:hypothetical protein